MTLIERDITAILADLPKLCALSDLVTGNTIMVKRGETGYWQMPHIDADGYNARHGITPAQVRAMETGSHFGFHVPGAEPINCKGHTGA